MTLKDLKSKATASELCLIEAVVTAVGASMKQEVLNRIVRFIRDHNPPCMEDIRHDQNALKLWAARLEESITTKLPTD